MRVALNFQAPAIEQWLQDRFPAVELVRPMADHGWQASALLTPIQSAELPLGRILGQAQGLRWVHVLGTGIEGFPMDEVGDAQVTCSRGAMATPIAEWVLAMMLAFEKRLPQSWIREPPARWYRAELGSLVGKTLGLVGFGSTGQAVAKRALAFDMRVLAKARTYRSSPMPGVTLVEPLDTLLQASDHLVMALPATRASEALLNSDTLAQVKSGVHLINVGCARALNQQALRVALDSGRVAQASLDVVEPEPLPARHWLYSHPRVRLSPHISWSGPAVTERLLDTFRHNLLAFQQGEPLQGIVDRRAGY